MLFAAQVKNQGSQYISSPLMGYNGANEDHVTWSKAPGVERQLRLGKCPLFYPLQEFAEPLKQTNDVLKDIYVQTSTWLIIMQNDAI